MDSAHLRSLQAPLKDRYRADPTSAHIPLNASGDCQDDGVTATVRGWGGPVRAGLHPSTGGDGTDACSGDMLLQALLACAGVTLRSVATAMGLPLRRVDLQATGYFDARGTLGLDRAAPVGVQGIVVTIDIDSDADETSMARLAQATERYCVVSQSLAHSPEFVIRRRTTPQAQQQAP